MKNYEKYVDKIKEYGGNNFCSMFIEPHILKSIGLSCDNLTCGACRVLQLIWLTEGGDPKEPKVDWSGVEVDTPILVRQGKNGEWLERHFAKYENGDVYAWVDGQTSWTGADKIKWKYAKLAENEKECKESKVDWSKVNVDTPILVGEGDGDWVKRYFAEYKDGIVYAWREGSTSWGANNMMMSWKYAKLVEDEE